MSSSDPDRETDIKITLRAISVKYNGSPRNIFDSPGHRDFGGKVLRVVSTVDRTALFVDTEENCKQSPRETFVITKLI